jgi:hypothetical protein
MSKISSRLIGTTITTTASFKDDHGDAIIPSTVKLLYKSYSGVIVERTVLPVDGKFTEKVLLDTAGVWSFRWESLTGDTVADEFTISVTDTMVK